MMHGASGRGGSALGPLIKTFESQRFILFWKGTIDGEEILLTSWFIVYPIDYSFFFHMFKWVQDFFHQGGIWVKKIRNLNSLFPYKVSEVEKTVSYRLPVIGC